MNIQLSPQSERLLQEQLSRGEFHSPEEVIERALEAFQKGTSGAGSRSQRSAEQAVRDILELRKGVKLGGLKIKDLIHDPLL